MVEFKSKIVDVGHIKPKKPVTVQFPFEGDKSEIEDTAKSCGCTVPVVKDGHVEVTYSPGDQKGKTSKRVWVYLKSDLPMWITKDGHKFRNPQRPIIELVIQGEIV